MADEAQTQMIRSINWREVFPFTHLFRAFRIAVHPSKLLLALAALLLIYLGGRVLDGVWREDYKPYGPRSIEEYVRAKESSSRLSAPIPAGYPELPPDWNRLLNPELAPRSSALGMERAARSGVFISFFQYEVAQVNNTIQNALALNWYGTFNSIWNFVAGGPRWLFDLHPLFAVLFTAWFLLVWSVFGGAVSRIAAVHVARDEKISVRQALRFSISKVLSFLFAPLIPLLIILVIGAIVAATGWVLLHIPYVGPILTGVLFFLALIAGFVMTLVALGTLAGFNLMFPTVAVEGSDSFDAISRSFSYVFARPWRMLWYTLVALVYGGIAYLFVKFFIFVMLTLTHFFVGWWLGNPAGRDTAKYWKDPSVSMWPAPAWDNLTYNVNYGALKWSEDVAAGTISFWVYLTIGLLGAFAISFYFSANTIIYYLMRREVDATELDDVYVEETEDEFGDAPVAAGAGPAAGEAASTSAAAGLTAAGPTAAAPAASSSVPEGPAGGAGAYGGPEGETRPTSPPDSPPGSSAADTTGATGTPPGGAPTV